MYSSILIFFICNTIEGQLISTGAFEVTFNGECFVIIRYETQLNRQCLLYMYIVVSFKMIILMVVISLISDDVDDSCDDDQ